MRGLLAALLLTGTVWAAPEFRFADRYRASDLPARQQELIEDYVRHESPFFRAARSPESALSYDGLNLSPETGQAVKIRSFTAPSKECLDLGLLIKAVEGNRLANLLVSREEAVDLLACKLRGYQAWNAKYPGFRGYMPWFHTDRLEPTEYVRGDIPGLDNGEWIWAMLVVERELRTRGYRELARGYADYLAMMRRAAVPIFWDPDRRLQRSDVHVDDPHSAATTYSGKSFMQGEHGVHEGIMILLFVTLLGDGLPPGASDDIWNSTRMVRVETKYGTTWQGWYGSAHESWHYLFLPMRDLPEFRQLFRIREIIRSQNAAERHYPGFATSALAPGDSPDRYLDGAGIEGVTSQALRNQHIYTLYGAFPSLLLDGQPGMAWVLNMLQGPRMQGPLGAGEAGTNDGTAVTPVKTCDGTYPNLLALMGGLERETAEVLQEQGVYERFQAILRQEYQEAFGTEPLREPFPFALPTQRIPRDRLSDYKP